MFVSRLHKLDIRQGPGTPPLDAFAKSKPTFFTQPSWLELLLFTYAKAVGLKLGSSLADALVTASGIRLWRRKLLPQIEIAIDTKSISKQLSRVLHYVQNLSRLNMKTP